MTPSEPSWRNRRREGSSVISAPQQLGGQPECPGGSPALRMRLRNRGHRRTEPTTVYRRKRAALTPLFALVGVLLGASTESTCALRGSPITITTTMYEDCAMRTSWLSRTTEVWVGGERLLSFGARYCEHIEDPEYTGPNSRRGCGAPSPPKVTCEHDQLIVVFESGASIPFELDTSGLRKRQDGQPVPIDSPQLVFASTFVNELALLSRRRATTKGLARLNDVVVSLAEIFELNGRREEVESIEARVNALRARAVGH